MKKLIGLFFLFFSLTASAQMKHLEKLNLDHFSVREKNISVDFKKYLSGEFLNHPELGILPFNGPPCNTCIERIDKRDAFSRYFIDPASGVSTFFQEVANSPINYQDEKGWWMEINHRLIQQDEKIFVATNQPTPVRIDLINRIISIGKNDQQIQTEIPLLFWRDDKGEDHDLGTANLNSITAGDDGLKIIDIYPGIDLIVSLRIGEVETNFILNNRLPYSTGTIILKQPFTFNENLNFQSNASIIPSNKEIYIVNDKNIPAYTIEKGIAFSSNPSLNSLNLQSKIAYNKILEFSIPTEWLNDPGTHYPVVIDPLITTSNTLPTASIAGTRYSPVCWTNGCDYFLTVPTPPNSTIAGIYHSFEYYATGLCFSDDGGYSIDFLGCHSPAGSPGVFTDLSHLTNFNFTADTVLLPEFNSCFPAPSCTSQNLNFTLHFFRCNNDPDTTCSANCIRATQPWIMFVKGNTLELSSVSSASFICEGTGSFLSVTPQYGVTPYGYLWSPVGATTDTITVFPTTTTSYTVTVTDACGTTASASSTVFVTNNNNPSFTVTPNPVCENSPVTINGNGSGAASEYDWFVSGSNAPGGIVNDNQNPVVNYNLPGVYDVILSFGSCGFQDTVQLTVDAMQPADVSITAQPSLTICTGDVITFHALPVNGGPAPTYVWLVDSILVQNGPSDSLVTSVLNNGSSVQVIMQSNSPCTSNTLDTATVFIAVSSSLTPQVSISPDTIVCPGSSITLNTTATNEGSTPLYQWYSNGLPIAGANAPTYTLIANPPDTIISVEVTSSFSCVTSPTATDSTTINFFTNIFAGVALTANPVGIVCSGDSIVYTAHPVNGGSTPQFDWYVNGVLIVRTDSVFSYFPANNDSISVLMTSSIACATITTDDDYNIAAVSASVSPTVSIAATPSTSVCQGDTVNFTASAANAGSNPTYAWTVNGNSVGMNDSLLTYFSFNNNDIVEVVVSSSLNCAPIPSDTDDVSIIVFPNVTPSVSLAISGGTACEGSPVQFIATPINGGTSPALQWFVNGVSSGLNNDTVVLTTLNSGDTLEVFMTSSVACTSPAGAVTSTYLVALQPRVTPDITIIPNPIDSVCLGQSVEITAMTLNGGSAPNVRWYVNGNLSASNTNLLNGITFSQGDIIVANLVSSEQCLTNPVDTSNFIRIFYRSPVNVTLTSGLLGCTGAPTTVRATASGGTGGPYQLSWSDGTIGIDSITVLPNNNTIIKVQATDNCTAISASDSLFVPVLPSPVANYNFFNPYEGAFLNTIQFVNSSTNTDNLVWYFPDSNTTSTVNNPMHTFPRKGTYDIKLFTMNNSGCTDSITYRVTVGEEIAVFYPNSFTPDGDGNNDFFRPIGASIEDYELLIYNRWGQVIYKGDNKSVWDGRINNTAVNAPEGVYVFRIELKFASRADEVVTGRITLIR